jgi:hypothetical protein
MSALQTTEFSLRSAAAIHKAAACHCLSIRIIKNTESRSVRPKLWTGKSDVPDGEHLPGLPRKAKSCRGGWTGCLSNPDVGEPTLENNYWVLAISFTINELLIGEEPGAGRALQHGSTHTVAVAGAGDEAESDWK